MQIEFKNYQENAIVELRQRANKLLENGDSEVLVFKSPTGSGKTLMVAEFLKRLIDSRADTKTFSFIWIAVHRLHDQSKESLEKYYNQTTARLKCSYFADLEDRKIGKNEILFLNWHSINKEKNIYIRANERDNNLDNIITRTKEEGRTVILIIDESHDTASSEKSQEIIASIEPKITIEVSATPNIRSDYIVPVKIKDVREEEMIKKMVVVNDGFKNYTIDRRKSDETADEIVLKSALQKRKDLQKLLEKEKSTVNPLLLIQLPNTKTGVPDKKEDVLHMLSKFGYTQDSNRIAIYLTGKEKLNLENIEKPENEVEVMLFKQAIALGWDCPRATILVLFRQWTDQNIIFSIQTLGRIMRMPEHRHYRNNKLNTAYLYTSLPDIATRVDESILPDFKVHTGKRIPSYKNINLDSYHSKRHREETRLSSNFLKFFLQAAEELNLENNISKKHKIVDTKLIADGRIINTDREIQTIQKSGTLSILKNEVELQNAFDMFVRDNLHPFHPETRSIKRINDSIYAFFGASRKEDDWPKIQSTVLAEENRQAVIDVINKAKEMYKERVGSGKHELVKNREPWNVPEEIRCDTNSVKKTYKKSVIQPYYARSRSTDGGKVSMFDNIEEDSSIEIEFIKYLEKQNKIIWWFKNGSQDGTYFAVPHIENNLKKAFYVDFIVLLKNGKIGLFDTKGGLTAQTAKSRAEGLTKYIKEQNKKGKKLFGGIVIKDGNSWRYNDSNQYGYNPGNLNDWKFLNFE